MAKRRNIFIIILVALGMNHETSQQYTYTMSYTRTLK